MTGLNLGKDKIIEIAVIVTDGSLNMVEEGPDLVIHQPQSVMDGMNDWCVEHHGKSGLTAEVLLSTTTTAEAEAAVLEFVKRYIPVKGVGVLAGNSVHVDKEFLRKEMPAFLDHLHYRLIDVSTLKELARRWNPAVFHRGSHKTSDHRAMGDIRDSIAELRYYRDAFLKLPA
ncbi:Oligoribonuclease, mitochondrial [Irineochytrium annulatum]|nr:Oligoribonuclease, mitochondrial [Irineochytrium annulatum]